MQEQAREYANAASIGALFASVIAILIYVGTLLVGVNENPFDPFWLLIV